MKKIYIIFTIVAVVLVVWLLVSRQQISLQTESKVSQIIELKNGDSYTLTAGFAEKNIGGKSYKVLAYNNSIPGPTIKVLQGSEVIVNLKNDLDTATTLHPHGLRLDNAFDGVPDVTQKAINPGESFVYKLKFPDVGVYWYHPHIDEVSGQALGLYGNFLVTPKDPTYWSPVNREVPLMVSDLLMGEKGIVPFGKPSNHALMGRYGNTLLVNGDTNYMLKVKQGEVVRFFVTNAANTRTFNLAIPGVKMKLVGADNGKYERETWADSVTIAPSERAIIEALFDESGTYMLEHKTPTKTYTLGNVEVSEEKVADSFRSQFQSLRTNEDVIKSIDPFRAFFKKSADKKIALTVDMGAMGGMMGGHRMPDGTMMGGGNMVMEGDDEGKIEWEDSMVMMNQMSTTEMIKWKIRDLDTKKEGMDINWKFKIGDKIKVSIFNDPKSAHPMQHPIHFHGQRFLVLSTNGVKNENLVWKDTALVQKGDTVEVLVDMKNPGDWMAHCHIAEHLESGMMANFKVE